MHYPVHHKSSYIPSYGPSYTPPRNPPCIPSHEPSLISSHAPSNVIHTIIPYTPSDQKPAKLYPFILPSASLSLAPTLCLNRRRRQDGLRWGVEVHERRPRRRSPRDAVERHKDAQGASSVLFGRRHRCRSSSSSVFLGRRRRASTSSCAMRCFGSWWGSRRRRRGLLVPVAWVRCCFFSSAVIDDGAAAADAAAVPGDVSCGSSLNLFDQLVCVRLFVCSCCGVL